MKKHTYETDSKIIQCLLKLQIVQEIERTTQLESQRLMAFKMNQLLLMARKFSNFDWENKHHLYVKVTRTKDNGT
jgi:hypothetical protein